MQERLAALLREGLAAAAPALGVDGDLPEPEILRPKQREHGDFSTNVALALATRAGRPPREVAAAIADALPPSPFVERVEIAGPGFLNLFVTDSWLHDALREIVDRGPAFGRAQPTGRRVQVEFVSANPTGPLTIGHARNAAIGDALARLLEFRGWAVEREYYYNDAGGQMDRFGESVEAWYLKHCGVDAEVPEDGYHGSYISELALRFKEEVGPLYVDWPHDKRLPLIRQAAAETVLLWIDKSLHDFGVEFDLFRSESNDLAATHLIEQTIARLQAAGFLYSAEGATWFRSTDFGDDKDRVLVRSNGVPTYFAADCAYVVDKFNRGFDHLIYVWGADHHGDVVRVKGAAQALGFDAAAVEILIYQWVSFMREGKPVPMSKRAGTFVTLDELIQEVGTDAARYHLLMFSIDAAVNFDIETVKQQTMENPVYYVQYGHARIAAILRKAEREGVVLGPLPDADLSLLSSEEEVDLLRALAEVPGVIEAAADLRAPHRLTHAAQDLAAKFHRFYTERRVVSDDPALTQARLWLCFATKQVLAILLGLLGVSAPESMERSAD